MSSPTTASQPHQTTQSSQKTDGRFSSGKQHPKWLGSRLLELKGKVFGSVTVISSQIHRVKGYPYVKAKCALTGITKLVCLNSLKRGLTTSFLKNGRRPIPQAKVLGRRYDAIIARCNNPSHEAYKDYGARGIKCLFGSRMEFILWVVKNLPHQDYKGVEIDRKNNDGHYEPQNLRLATRLQQVRNRRNTAKILWEGRLVPLMEFKSPFSYNWTYKLMKQGLTADQILAKRGSTT